MNRENDARPEENETDPLLEAVIPPAAPSDDRAEDFPLMNESPEVPKTAETVPDADTDSARSEEEIPSDTEGEEEETKPADAPSEETQTFVTYTEPSLPEEETAPFMYENAESIEEATSNTEPSDDVSTLSPRDDDEDHTEDGEGATESDIADAEASGETDGSDETDGTSSLPVPTEQAKKDAPKEKEPKPRGVDSRFDLAELFIFSLVAVLLISAFIFRHTVVEGGSMENTLHDGENLIISDLFYTPKTGDIVVCEDYHTPFRKPLIKRVIATGGQTVMILPTGVYVDGFLLEEEYVHTEAGYRYTPMAEFTVPEGMIFVMGDHRDNSTDSRSFGCVSEESVLGRVLLRYYPFSRFGTVD